MAGSALEHDCRCGALGHIHFGDIFNYDSGNPHLLSAILTKLTGISALDYTEAKLFGPLGIGAVSGYNNSS